MNDRSTPLSALWTLDPGCSREEWVRFGMAAKAAGVSFDDFHAWSKGGANYGGEEDCRRVWDSFREDGGITAGTLFGGARKQGWRQTTRASSTHLDRPKGHLVYTPRPRSLSPVLKAGHHAIHVQAVWDDCVPAEAAHQYIVKKRGLTEGLRVYPPNAPLLFIQGQNVAGWLVVPCGELDGTLRTLQFIPPPGGGNKLNLPQSPFGEGYFAVGNIVASSSIFIVEGIGQAWAISQASGHAAVVCFGASRMRVVATTLAAAYPSARLILAPDRGMEERAKEIAREVSGEWVALPAEKPNNYDANDYMGEFGMAALGELLVHTRRPSLRFKLLNGDDLSAVAPLQWLVRGALPATGIASIYGPTGSGKSFLVLHLAMTIASGIPSWFGRRATQAPVTYVALEGEAGLPKRVDAWCSFHKSPIPAQLRFITQPIDLLRTSDITDLANAIRASGAAGGLVIIDTLNRSAPGADENSSVDMGKIIAAAKQLQALVGGLLLLIHHTGKDASKGLRGHSSLHAALDSAIEVVHRDNARAWKTAKCKDDQDGEVHRFRLDIQVVGRDPEGDEITSCVPVPDFPIGVVKKTRLPGGGNQKIALDALAQLLDESGELNKDGAPPNCPCVRVSAAIEYVAQRLICNPKHRRDRAADAVNGLVARGIYRMENDWLWCP